MQHSHGSWANAVTTLAPTCEGRSILTCGLGRSARWWNVWWIWSQHHRLSSNLDLGPVHFLKRLGQGPEHRRRIRARDEGGSARPLFLSLMLEARSLKGTCENCSSHAFANVRASAP